jgi:hypothetical protein
MFLWDGGRGVGVGVAVAVAVAALGEGVALLGRAQIAADLYL